MKDPAPITAAHNIKLGPPLSLILKTLENKNVLKR